MHYRIVKFKNINTALRKVKIKNYMENFQEIKSLFISPLKDKGYLLTDWWREILSLEDSPYNF